jgi:hypothetical protein
MDEDDRFEEVGGNRWVRLFGRRTGPSRLVERLNMSLPETTRLSEDRFKSLANVVSACMSVLWSACPSVVDG